MSRIGILGAGQLGRMLGLAGIAMGHELRFFDSNSSVPASAVGELVCADFGDELKLDSFCSGLDVVTYEFENVPLRSAERVSRILPLFPPAQALAVSQDRFREKSFFKKLGIATPRFALIAEGGAEAQCAAVQQALAEISLPCVLKTNRFGYDGKGQHVLRSVNDIGAAVSMLSEREGILEQFISFSRELSVVAVRTQHGEFRCYPLIENVHRQGILRTSSVPVRDVSEPLRLSAETAVRAIAEELSYVGVLALELFQCGEELLANEMAPRVHNSGHWTMEGAETSQFENHLRAILNLPLGSTALRGVSLMVNLIGYIPDTKAVLEIPGASLHIYGKEIQPGRKVGHVTLNARNEAQLRRAEERLRGAFERDGYLF